MATSCHFTDHVATQVPYTLVVGSLSVSSPAPHSALSVERAQGMGRKPSIGCLPIPRAVASLPSPPLPHFSRLSSTW